MWADGHPRTSRSLALSLGVCALAIVMLAPITSAATPKTKLASQNNEGFQANQESLRHEISASGRFVVYDSDAGNLVAEDLNGRTDIFIRDFKAGTTKLVNSALGGGVGNGGSARPTVSGNGRFIAFLSTSTDLIAGGTNGLAHVFVRDRKKGKTELISKSSVGTQANGGSLDAVISADGRWVAFESGADNLVVKDTKGKRQIYLFDRDTDKLILVSRNNAGTAGNGQSEEPAISANGRYIVYQSSATNLKSKDNKSRLQIFLFDKRKKRTEFISRNKMGKAGNDHSVNPAISGDGARVVYASAATNLGKDTNGRADAYMRDRKARKTSRVSLNWKGKQLNGGNAGANSEPDISASGRWVAFKSSAKNATKGSTHSGVYYHIYARDLVSGTIKRISRRAKPANDESDEPELSRDGTFVSFRSDATNLIKGGDANGDKEDIFRRGPIR
jgi:Tol biopolymer transport system component